MFVFDLSTSIFWSRSLNFSRRRLLALSSPSPTSWEANLSLSATNSVLQLSQWNESSSKEINRIASNALYLKVVRKLVGFDYWFIILNKDKPTKIKPFPTFWAYVFLDRVLVVKFIFQLFLHPLYSIPHYIMYLKHLKIKIDQLRRPVNEPSVQWTVRQLVSLLNKQKNMNIFYCSLVKWPKMNACLVREC